MCCPVKTREQCRPQATGSAAEKAKKKWAKDSRSNVGLMRVRDTTIGSRKHQTDYGRFPLFGGALD